MNAHGIVKFLLALGQNADDISDSGRGWIQSPCPLAPYLHESGEDERPSFGISINEDGGSVYYCFGCTAEPRPIGWLLHNFFIHEAAYPWEAAKVFLEEEIHEYTGKKVEAVADKWVKRFKKEKPLQPAVIKQFPLLQGRKDFEAKRSFKFLIEERRISQLVINLCGIRYNPDASSVVFPLTDVNGRIFVMRERSRKAKRVWTVDGKAVGLPNVKFPKLRFSGVWFGMHLVDWSKPVMLIESELEMMTLKSMGFSNVIASATSSVTPAQMNALAGENYILGYDADKAGKHAHKRIARHLGDKATCVEADWSILGYASDPGDVANRHDLDIVLQNLTKIEGVKHGEQKKLV